MALSSDSEPAPAKVHLTLNDQNPKTVATSYTDWTTGKYRKRKRHLCLLCVLLCVKQRGFKFSIQFYWWNILIKITAEEEKEKLNLTLALLDRRQYFWDILKTEGSICFLWITPVDSRRSATQWLATEKLRCN